MTGPSPTFYLGTICSWNALTLENSVEVDGELLANLPVFGSSEVASLKVGDQVGIVTTDRGRAILGRLISPISERDDVAAAAELIRHLYVDLGQSTGGPLHLQLDDGNLDDEFLGPEDEQHRYVYLFDGTFERYAQAGERTSYAHRYAIRETCEHILTILRRLPVEDRRAAVRKADV